MKRKIVVIDTETGGLDAEHDAIMSIAMVVVHGNGIVGHTYHVVKDEGNISEEARAVNGIDEEEYARFGRSPGAVVDWIEDMYLEHDLREPRKVTLGGCQTDFDVTFLKRLYRLAGRDYNKRYDRRVLDISHGALLLEQAGRLDLRGDAPSLENICRAVGVPFTRKQGRHHALDDAFATANALVRMTDLLRHTNWPAHSL